ncbi:MAG: hypothetical protein P4L51_27105 [Puia sp.]|nr:hypothetical protein [Puia sp.]
MKIKNLPSRSPVFNLLFILFSISLAAHGQTADEIVSKHIAALGGKDLLNSLRTVYLEGVTVLPNGTEIDSKTWRVNGRVSRQEISLPMGNSVMIVTPQQGLRSNPRNGGAFEPIPDEQLKTLQMQLDLAGPFVDYAAKGYSLESLGMDTVNAAPCYKLRLTTKSGLAILYFLDAKTYYIVRETRKGSGMFGGGRSRGNGNGGGAAPNPEATYNIDFSDYQKTPEGYVFPATMIVAGGPRTSFEKIDVNKPVDEAKLSKP